MAGLRRIGETLTLGCSWDVLLNNNFLKGLVTGFYTYDITSWYTYVYDYFLMVLIKINIFY